MVVAEDQRLADLKRENLMLTQEVAALKNEVQRLNEELAEHAGGKDAITELAALREAFLSLQQKNSALEAENARLSSLLNADDAGDADRARAELEASYKAKIAQLETELEVAKGWSKDKGVGPAQHLPWRAHECCSLICRSHRASTLRNAYTSA